MRADLETEPAAESANRSSTSMENRPRKKKKKKKKASVEDPYSHASAPSLRRPETSTDMDNSTIGGVSEYDNIVYNVDSVQNFVDEPIENIAIQD